MRFFPNLLLVAAFLALLSALAPAAPPAPSNKLKTMAPADQYFGKLKLSFLGINNTFRDAGISAADHTTDPAIANKVDFAIDALNDWQKKFPRDPQLSRTYFLAQLTLKKIWIAKYQDKAWAYMQYIVLKYPATFYGRTVKAEIARGWTSHYYAPAVPCDAAATPAPSVTTNNGKYKTTVETPACITPSPSPSPAPEVSPSGEPALPPAVPAPASPLPPTSPVPGVSSPPAPSGTPAPATPPAPPSPPMQPAATPVPATSSSPVPIGSPAVSPSPAAT